jgi:hypothetical protein
MKRILIGFSLLAITFLAACGHSDRTILVNQPRGIAPTHFELSDIPYYEKPKFINVPADERLSGVDISLLLSGQTVISRSIDEAAAMQYSFFEPDGLLAINPRPDRLVLGRWRIERDLLCYELGHEDFCSALFRSSAQANGVHIYYFARIDDGISPTVFIDDIQGGDTIPLERLPKAL